MGAGLIQISRIGFQKTECIDNMDNSLMKDSSSDINQTLANLNNPKVENKSKSSMILPTVSRF